MRLLFYIPFNMLLLVYKASVLKAGYEWFFMDTYGLPEVSLLNSYIFIMLFGLIRNHYDDNQKESKEANDSMMECTVHNLLTPTLALVVMYVLTLF